MDGELLLKRVHQTLPPAEEAVFQEWLAQDDRHRVYFERMQRVWLAEESTSSLESDIPGVMARFDEYVRKEQVMHHRKMLRIVYRYAACLFLLLAIGGGILLLYREKQPVVLVEGNVAKEIVPGGNKAIILFSDGNQVVIDSLTDMAQYEAKGIEIEKSAGTIRYIDRAHSLMEYNTIIIPRGGEYHVVLSDGTEVWLNSESQLRIPTVFAGSERRVSLSGEAYFAVTKDSRKPFVVETDLGNVKVYGTEFNVKRYPDEAQLKATLVKGSIGFSSSDIAELKIKPGYQLSLAEGSRQPDIRQVKIYNEIAWKNRQFCFESETLGEIMATLQRWYDVRVVFVDPALKAITFSGTLNRYDKIESILHFFEAGFDIRFLIEGDTIKVMRK